MNGLILGALVGLLWDLASTASVRRLIGARTSRQRAALPMPVLSDRAVPVLSRGAARAQAVEDLLNSYEIVVGERWFISTSTQGEPTAERRNKLKALEVVARDRAHRFRSAVLEELTDSNPTVPRSASTDQLADAAIAMVGAGRGSAVLELIEPHEDRLGNPRLMLAYAAALRQTGEHSRVVDLIAEQIHRGRYVGADRLMMAKVRIKAICAGTVGTHDEAVEAAEYTLRLAPEDASALYFRGLADLKFGKFTPAGTKAGLQALSLDPTNPAYLHLAICTARRTGDSSGALEYATRLLALERPQPAIGSLVLAHMTLSEYASRRWRMFSASLHLRQALEGSTSRIVRSKLVIYALRWTTIVSSFGLASATWIAGSELADAGEIPLIVGGALPILTALVGLVTVFYVSSALPRAEVWRTLRATRPRVRTSVVIALASAAALALCAAPGLNRTTAALIAATVISIQIVWSIWARTGGPNTGNSPRKHRAA
ncbi:MAG: hypothetical protein ACTHJM_08700 [Marmoricola sp.]